MQNRRNKGRVQFDHKRVVRIMARDGSWQRVTSISDVSDEGAKLVVEGSLNGLDLKDFFLALSPTGKAYRRCRLIWRKGDQLGVRFIPRVAPPEEGPATTYDDDTAASASAPAGK